MNITKKIIGLSLLILLLSAFGTAEAQTTAVDNYSALITWRANNYFPSNFRGKALPTNGTTVSLSAVLLDNQKIQDVSGLPILWYVDGNFLNGGIGDYQTSFQVTKTAGSSHMVNVQIGTANQTVSASIAIPVVNYQAVVNVPYPADTVKQNSTANLEIIPYFFNVNSFGDFLFSWNINNIQNVTSTPQNTLSLNIGQVDPSQGAIGVNVSVQNTSNAFEFAYGKTNLYVEQ